MLETGFYPRRPRSQHYPIGSRLRPGCMFSARRTSSRTSSKWPRLWRDYQVWRDNRAGRLRGEKHSVLSHLRPKDHCAADLAVVPGRRTMSGEVRALCIPIRRLRVFRSRKQMPQLSIMPRKTRSCVSFGV